MKSWAWLIVLSGLACSNTPEPTPQTAAIFFADEHMIRVNPDLNPQIELVIRASEGVREIEASIEGETAEFGARDQGNGRFITALELNDLADGDYTITADGHGVGYRVQSGQRRLRVSRRGVRHTDFDAVGTALSPGLHHVDGKLAITWTDRRNDERRLYWQQLNDLLEPAGEPVALTEPSWVVARAEVAYDGQGHFGVLMQTLEGEGIRQSRLMIVDLEGAVIMPPVSMDQEGENGRPGGGISYDGEAFVAVTRSYSEQAEHIRYARFSAQGMLTQPTVIASAGDGPSVGGFLPFMTLSVVAQASQAVVGFKRERFDQRLDMNIQRNHIAVVDRSGTVVFNEELSTELNLSFDQEVSVHRVGGQVVTLWTTTDLTSDEANPPYMLYGNEADLEVGPSRWRPLLLADQPLDRTDFALAEDPNGYGQMLWQDLRFRAEDEGERLRLMTASLSDDFRLGEPKVLDHPRVFLGVSHPKILYHRDQFIMTWVDVRHSEGQTIKSEIYLESMRP
jgi:hypothetical protein